MANRRSKTTGGKPQRHISVRGVQRDKADLRKLSRALIRLAMESAAAEAAAKSEHEADAPDPGQTSA